MANQPVNDKPVYAHYTATAGQTSLPFGFWVHHAADLDIYINGVLLAENAFSVADAYLRNDNGGFAVVSTPLTLADDVFIVRNSKIDRMTGFSEAGAASFTGGAINLEFSRMIAMLQEMGYNLARKIGLSPSSGYTGSLTLPTASANRGLKWNATANALINTTYDPDAAGNAEAFATAAGASATAAAASQTASATSASNAAASALAAQAVGNGVLTTKGDLVGFSTVAARLAVGSNGQVLTADSAQTLGFKWATPTAASDTASGIVELATNAEALTGTDTVRAVTPAALAATLATVGGVKLLATATASNSASLDFNGFFTSAYDEYLLILQDMVPQTGSSNNLQLRYMQSGSAVTTGNYNQGGLIAGTTSNITLTSQTAILPTGNTLMGTSDSISGCFYLKNPLNSSRNKKLHGNFAFNVGSAMWGGDVAGTFTGNTNALSGIQSSFSGGNTASGKGYLYGIKNT